MSVVELGYVGLDVTDLSAWREFATSVAGFQYVDGPTSDVAFLRMDYWHHRFALHQGQNDDLAYIGFRVSDAEAFEEMEQRLSQAGYAFQRGSEADEENRCVMGLLKLNSPGGIPVEIFWGPQMDSHRPFHPGRPMHGRFVTGGCGLGHVALREPDAKAALAFYRLLGFKGGPEYKVALPGGIVVKPCFMHCNPRQHTLQFDLGPMQKRLNHIMVEYGNIDDVGLARDIVDKRQIDVGMHLGKHANDQAFSFYVGTPSKWLLELGWNVRPTPAHAEYSRVDIFGHAVGASGYGLDGLQLIGD